MAAPADSNGPRTRPAFTAAFDAWRSFLSCSRVALSSSAFGRMTTTPRSAPTSKKSPSFNPSASRMGFGMLIWWLPVRRAVHDPAGESLAALTPLTLPPGLKPRTADGKPAKAGYSTGMGGPFTGLAVRSPGIYVRLHMPGERTCCTHLQQAPRYATYVYL